MNKLNHYRKMHGLSLQELSDAVGVAKGQLHALEKDGANPVLRSAYRLSKFFDVPVEAIWPNDVEIIEETIVLRRVARDGD